MENKNTMLTSILAIGLILVSLLVIYQTKTQDTNTISVTGSYSTKADPDQGEITFRVITRGETALEAQKANSKIAENLVKSLKDAGLNEKDIETISYYSNKRTVWENNSHVEKGFEVVNSMKIKTKNLDQLGKLVDIASKNGAEKIDSLEFTLSEEKKEEVYQEALGKSGENARERANKLANSIGFKIKKVKSISLETPITPYYARGLQFMQSGTDYAVESETPIQPKTLNIDVKVNVVFEIN